MRDNLPQYGCTCDFCEEFFTRSHSFENRKPATKQEFRDWIKIDRGDSDPEWTGGSLKDAPKLTQEARNILEQQLATLKQNNQS